MIVARLMRAIAFAALWTAGLAQASAAGVVISQVYGSAGSVYSRDFVEIFNASATPVSVAGWSIQYASAAGTGNFAANGVVVLSGTLQPGQYQLVGLATGSGGTALPTPDASGTINLSGTAGKVILANVATGLACNGGSAPCSAVQLAQIVDLVGYGTTANFFEGAGRAPAPATTQAVLRAAAGCTDTDNNSSDFVAAPPTPRNSASPLAPCGAANAPVVAQCPAQASVASGSAVSLVLAASDADGVVNQVAFGGGQAAGMSLANFSAATANGGTARVDLAVGSAVAAGSYSVAVDFGTGTQTGRCTVAVTVAAPAASFTAIGAIQGTGATSPLVGQSVTTRGVVTKVNNNGYFLQDPAGDGDEATSDGLFVFTSSAPSVEVGRLVEVSGLVAEFNVGSATNALTLAHTVTELTGPGAALLLGQGNIAPTSITLPEATPDWLERHEGMLVSIDTPMVVSQNFFQGRYGQVTLGAQARLVKPTQLHRPGTAPALALADQNARASIVLDDGSSQQNPSPIPYIGVDNTLRAGDTLPGVVGVIDYGLATNSADGLADWRIHPTAVPLITRANGRPAMPPALGGNLKVATFNVLNFFTTFADGNTAFGQTGQGCAPSLTTADCRGADNATEFARQRAKIVAALAALDADVVGLIELQNNGDVAAQHLVDQLNAQVGAGTYAVVPAPATTGTDAIRVSMIHKPARVARVGAALADADTIHNRPPMAQAFRLLSTQRVFSVVVSHFKSKSCTDATGADADQGDGQGCYNARRTQQAQRLLTFLGSVQAAAGSSDALLIGDFNAYAEEDPMHTFAVAGLVEQTRRFDPASYSFVFDGEAGSLDHVLATPALSARVTSAAHWHINADEPSVIDYNTEFKPQDFYSATPFRSSDHDPALVGIDLVVPLTQTITFPVLLDQVLGESPQALAATASSGLAVSYSALTPTVCAVTGAQLSLLAAGSCTLAADQPGDASYQPAVQVVRSFAVRQAQAISFAQPAAADLASGSVTLSPSASSGLTVMLTSSTPAVCSVAGNLVTLLSAGTCTLEASQAGDGLWAPAANVVRSFAVQAGSGGAADGDVPLPLWAWLLLASGLAWRQRRRLN